MPLDVQHACCCLAVPVLKLISTVSWSVHAHAERCDCCNLTQADAGKMFKHFHPAFRDCDPSLATASALFMAFAFRKPPAAGPAAAPPSADARTTAPRPTAADERAEGNGAGTVQLPAQQQHPEEQQQPAAESRKRAAPAAPATKRPTIRRRGGRPVDGGGPAPAAEQEPPGGT